MGATPDRRPGESNEEGVVFENRPIGEDPTVIGGMRFVNGAFLLRDGLGVYNPRSGAASIFGEAYTYGSSEPQSDTTSSSYQTKLTVTTPSVNLGTYVIFWSAEFSTSNSNKQIDMRVQLDGSTDLVSGSPHTGAGGIWTPCSSFVGYTLSGVHTLTIQWKNASTNNTASIRRARLALWRTT